LILLLIYYIFIFYNSYSEINYNEYNYLFGFEKRDYFESYFDEVNVSDIKSETNIARLVKSKNGYLLYYYGTPNMVFNCTEDLSKCNELELISY